MAATPAWYYRARHGIVGPVSAAVLKRLVEQGAIDPTTSIRRGDDGPWFPAERVYDALIPVAEVESIDTPDGEAIELAEPIVAPDSESAEWYFSREDGRKLGPVPRSVVIAMARQGKLKPIDRVWKAGMASWVPAAECPEFTDAFSTQTAPIRPGKEKHRGRRLVVSPSPAIAAVAVALLASLATALWAWVGRGRDRTDTGRAVRSTESGAIAGPAAVPGPKATEQERRPAGDDPEPLFRDALAAVRGGNLTQARILLNRYLSRPEARKQAEAARMLLREIDLATSASEADALARRLDDQALKGYLATQGQPLVDRSMQTPELRAIYARTLIQAFRQESNRRQSAPKGGVALAQSPPAVPPRGLAAAPKDPADDDPDADRLPASLLGSDDERAPDPGKVADRKGGTTIERILDAPESFEGRTIELEGLYRVGTLLTPLKDSKGNEIGWSLPVGGDDDRLICKGDDKAVGRDRYLILDSGVAPLLLKVYDDLKFRPAARPTYKCALTVTVRAIIVNNTRIPAVMIDGLEILGVCNFLRVAQRQYDKAFWTVHVTPEKAWVAYGDGASWVERLGGEEKFLKPLRKKLRDLQRKAIADRGHAMMGRILQAELGRSVNMAIANQQQQARFAAAFFGRR